MIVVELNGGLGNQLFQFATGFSLAQENAVKLILDASILNKSEPNKTNRQFELNKFDSSLKCEANPFRYYLKNPKSILRRITKRMLYPDLNVYYERNMAFDKHVLELGPNVFLSGYFQNQNYFLKYKNELILKLNNTLLLTKSGHQFLDEIRAENAISVHIRRGDYVSNSQVAQYHGNLSLDYYNRAIELIKSNFPNSKFYFFSDDIEWVKAQAWGDINVKFVENPDQPLSHIDDLILMANCNHHIIANSSFSWWAAWLNAKTEKEVICPTRWFADISKNDLNICPNDWKRI